MFQKKSGICVHPHLIVRIIHASFFSIIPLAFSFVFSISVIFKKRIRSRCSYTITLIEKKKYPYISTLASCREGCYGSRRVNFTLSGKRLACVHLYIKTWWRPSVVVAVLFCWHIRSEKDVKKVPSSKQASVLLTVKHFLYLGA